MEEHPSASGGKRQSGCWGSGEVEPADGVEEGEHDGDGGDEADEDAPEGGEGIGGRVVGVGGDSLETGEESDEVGVAEFGGAVLDFLEGVDGTPDPAGEDGDE